MPKAAIIVESPTKTRTIGRFVGKDYVLLASMGHVRDLPTRDLGVDVENDFAPTYTMVPRQKKILGELRKALKNVKSVYLATDPDREGEAIAWHLAEALKLKKPLRIEFNEITEGAVKAALESPREIDMDRVNAQQARRVLDRLVGYSLSPLLWKRIKGQKRGINLSAGRVQSVALRLVCDREREIAAFDPQEYWTIETDLAPAQGDASFAAVVVEWNGDKIEPREHEGAELFARDLAAQTCRVSGIEKKRIKVSPPLPLTTSSLQQDAASRIGLPAQVTMRVAQELYEGLEIKGKTLSLITYMRTDSTRVSKQAVGEIRGVVEKDFGSKYLGRARRARAKKGVQDAHEAIRPTYFDLPPDEVAPHLTDRQLELYRLIWGRSLAAQMADAEFDQTTVEIEAGPYKLRASGRVLVFDGWTAAHPPLKRQEDKELPVLTEGEELRLLEVRADQHFTRPPRRYTEATLVRALEEQGIGRPSTYAPTLHVLRQREYVRMEKRHFVPTPLGLAVCDYLVENFPQIMDVKFTATLETQLDTIEEGAQDWVALLRHFHDVFAVTVEAAATIPLKKLDETCPKCGAQLVEQFGQYGKFVGCAAYPECDYTRPSDLVPGEVGRTLLDERCERCGQRMLLRRSRDWRCVWCSGFPRCTYSRPVNGDESAPREKPEVTEYTCDRCGAPLVKRQGKRGPFYGCSAYPKCRNIKEIGEDGAPVDPQRVAPQETDIICEKCGAKMVVKQGKRGPFLACPNFPKCRNAKPLPPELKGAVAEQRSQPVETDEVCEECGRPMVVRQGRKGKFLGCSGYPKCRHTRPYRPADGTE